MRPRPLGSPGWRRLSTAPTPLSASPAAAQWVCRSCRRDQTRHLALRPSEHRLTQPTAIHRSATALRTRAFASSSRLQEHKPQYGAGPAPPAAAAPERVVTGEQLQHFVAVTRQSWNDLVGYTDIEQNRAKVAAQEEQIAAGKAALAEAREAHRAAVDRHAAALRETRDLLARKDEWAAEDAARFAALHVATRAGESDEKAARRALAEAEVAVERDTERLSARIGAVYQAESMYNAKVLQVKTWWTWALMAFNVSVFVFNVYLIQIGLNPRYRRDVDLSDKAVAKIVAALGEGGEGAGVEVVVAPRVEGAESGRELRLEASASDTVEAVKAKMQAETGLEASGLRLYAGDTELDNGTHLAGVQSGQGPLRLTFSADSASGQEVLESIPAQPPRSIMASTQARVGTLFSSKSVTWQMSEITTLALQSAATGAAAATLLALSLQKR